MLLIVNKYCKLAEDHMDLKTVVIMGIVAGLMLCAIAWYVANEMAKLVN